MKFLTLGKLSLRQRGKISALAVRWRGGRKFQERREESRIALEYFVLDLLAAVGVGGGLQLVDLRSILRCVEEVESTAVCNNIKVASLLIFC